MSWTADDSGKVAVSGSEVSYTGDHEKGNAIWTSGGTGYWEFKVGGSPGTWVGCSRQDKFGSGYKIKGFFFGGPGNLSDGSSLVTGQWGPSFGDGDVIGMRVEVTGDKTTIAFSKNGAGLGTAFEIEGWEGGEGLCPAVSMDKKGQKVTLTQGNMPDISTFQKAGGPAGKGPEGKWSGKCKFWVEKDGDNWRVGAKPANNMSCMVTQEADGSLKAGPVMSTMMMPPPHLQELEREVSGILNSLKGWRREGDNLVLVHAGGEESLGPDAGPGPAHRQNVNWLN